MGIATLAIAGIPPLAGFWSKDEILLKAFQSNRAYWLVGVITAFITSFYMFRLLFMTFFGDYRGAEVDAHGNVSTARDAHGQDSHGHGGLPHESPMVMLVPLMILAVLSLIGGFVGYHNGFEHFLAPVFSSGEGAEAAAEGSLALDRIAADGNLGGGRVSRRDSGLDPLHQQAGTSREDCAILSAASTTPW